jgi:myo-inositol-1(or 4)-monophosphatase
VGGELLALAEATAREAGALLREAFARAVGGDLKTEAKSSPTDLVSEADLAAERCIRGRLLGARPTDGLLGEEGDDVTGTSGVRWVVDPLDGTTNFLHGIPHWSVSIACEDADGALAGAVYDPIRDELWSATREGPAMLGGAPLDARDDPQLEAALVVTGFGYRAELRASQAATAARLLPEVSDLRSTGSAALDLSWTAAGRFDAYYERGIHRWDVAAGGLVCTRAGLAVRDLEAFDGEPAGVLAAPPGLASRLAERLA